MTTSAGLHIAVNATVVRVEALKFIKNIKRFTREHMLATENPGQIAEMEAVFFTSSTQGIQHHFICFTVNTIKHYEMPSFETFSLLNGLEQMCAWGRLLATLHRGHCCPGKTQKGHSSSLSYDNPEGSREKIALQCSCQHGLKRRSVQQDAAEGPRQCYKWNKPQGFSVTQQQCPL